MNADIDAERQYPDVVVFAVQYLLDLNKQKADVTPADISKAVAVAKALRPDVINAEREAWLQNDVTYLMEDFWETLTDKKNRGKRGEIIRGALR